MKSVLLILPNQLFKQHQGLQYQPDLIMLFEAALFFKDQQYPVDFHQQKLVLHRASMQAYQTYLHAQGWTTDYIDWQAKEDQVALKNCLAPYQDSKILLMDPVDYAMQQRLHSVIDELSLTVEWLESQAFINTRTENNTYRSQRKRWFMADFYSFQRHRLNILMDENKPVGGKWSFDADNRKKIPKKELSRIPALSPPVEHSQVLAAKKYVQTTFPEAIGDIEQYYYPTTFAEAEAWLDTFLEQRFAQFGPYEDALVPQQHWLYHSVLTPMLNIGLLTPQQVVSAALAYAEQHSEKPETKQQPIPLSSLEGFIRQIIGWREFMRATYDDLGVTMRTSNHWQHQRSIPDSFYTGTTGIAPIDDVIKHVLQTGYCHHIERLMVLGGFMFLCEFEPKQIYHWFMSLFIDAYDWVMVPNVFSMSQHADGGLITTKPYFSGSSYLRKMGYDTPQPDYAEPQANWSAIWDSLYWRWIWQQRKTLRKNPRWAMMCSMAEKMAETKMQQHLSCAEEFLASLDKLD